MMKGYKNLTTGEIDRALTEEEMEFEPCDLETHEVVDLDEAFETPEPMTIDEAQSIKLGELANFRWLKQQTFTYGGNTVWAEPAIKNITAKLSAIDERTARGNPPEAAMWKMYEGIFELLDRTAIADLGLAIDTYVQACFIREGELAQQIITLAGAVETTPEDIINFDITQNWPVA